MLPKVPTKIVKTRLPSNDEEITFRLMQAREDKILLMAKEGEDQGEILTAVKQIVQNVVLNEGFDADRLPVFDIEWLFIQTRIASIGSETQVSFYDPNDEKTYDFTVDLTTINVIRDESLKPHIDLGEGIAVSLKWPDAASFVDPSVLSAGEAGAAQVLAVKAIDRVYDGDKVIDPSTIPFAELNEFVDSFPIEAYETLLNFLSNMPRLNYVIQYTNSVGDERTITLSSLSDFFNFA
jgi:hypothetical protein